MAKCKFCGKSGLFLELTKNGMCPNCEAFVISDLRNRSRIFNESKELLYKSENPKVVCSRLKVAKDILAPLVIYEQKGIGVFQPLPSQLLKDIESEQDNIIIDCFDRAFSSLRMKLRSIKTQAAAINNLNKFIQEIDEYSPKVKNPTRLNQLRENVELLIKSTEGTSKSKNKVEKAGSVSQPDTSQPKSILLKEIHPAKLLYREKVTPNGASSIGGIQISIDITGNHQVEFIGPTEPSTIYEDLAIRKPLITETVERPPYYPSYVQLTPEQRWIYINWLTDISQQIDIGYVFLYYYGLERQLIVGDFESAFREIVFLRHIHNNKSFESYSYNALLYGAALKNRPDLVQTILATESQNGIDNADLLFKYRFKMSVTPFELMSMARKFKGTNLRYIKAVPKLFEAALSAKLQDEFGDSLYPFYDRFDIQNAPLIQSMAFANISFPDNLRTPQLPDFVKYEPFVNECILFINNAHQLVKEDLIRERLIQKG